jgi:hypothetical protein
MFLIDDEIIKLIVGPVVRILQWLCKVLLFHASTEVGRELAASGILNFLVTFTDNVEVLASHEYDFRVFLQKHRYEILSKNESIVPVVELAIILTNVYLFKYHELFELVIDNTFVYPPFHKLDVNG